MTTKSSYAPIPNQSSSRTSMTAPNLKFGFNPSCSTSTSATTPYSNGRRFSLNSPIHHNLSSKHQSISNPSSLPVSNTPVPKNTSVVRDPGPAGVSDAFESRPGVKPNIHTNKLISQNNVNNIINNLSADTLPPQPAADSPSTQTYIPNSYQHAAAHESFHPHKISALTAPTPQVPLFQGNNHRRSSSAGLGNRPCSHNFSPQAPPQNIPFLSRKFVARRISEGETGRLKEELKCQACGKGYKHITSLAKHLWEHTPEWSMTSKLLISKHQQVQLLEAASILVSINEPDEIEGNESQETSALTEPSSITSPAPINVTSPPPVPSSTTTTTTITANTNVVTTNTTTANNASIPLGTPQNQNVNPRPPVSQPRSATPVKLQKQSLVNHHRNERLSNDSYLQQTVTHGQPATEPAPSFLPSSKSSSPSVFQPLSDQGYLLEPKTHTPPAHSFETDASSLRSPCSLTNDNGLTPSPPPQPPTPRISQTAGTVFNKQTGSSVVSRTVNIPNAGPVSIIPTHSRSYSLSSSNTPYKEYSIDSNSNTNISNAPTPSSLVPPTHSSYITDSLYPSSVSSSSSLIPGVGTKKKRNGSKVDNATPNVSIAFQHEHQRTNRNRRYSSSATSVTHRAARNSINPLLSNNSNPPQFNHPFSPSLSTSQSQTIRSAVPPNTQRTRRSSVLDPPFVSTHPAPDLSTRRPSTYANYNLTAHVRRIHINDSNDPPINGHESMDLDIAVEDSSPAVVAGSRPRDQHKSSPEISRFSDESEKKDLATQNETNHHVFCGTD